MNANLKAVLNFLSYAGILTGLAGLQFLKAQYPAFDSSLIQMILIQTGTALGFFHLAGSPKSNSTTEDTK